jgi:hypothetical protein
MNSSISTATATFRGTFNLVSDLSLDLTATHAQIATALAGAIATADNNDYAFVQVPTAVGTPTEIASTDRYKFNGTAWAYEYTLNTSGFTSAQWAAINSGITAALVASLADIPDLIPSEATSANQLADKAYVLAQILAATPAFKGQFVTLAELQAVASPKAGDLGIVRTKDSDGMDVFTVYQYLNNAWNVFYSLSYHPQTKPATTGTTGDYPYNGMGCVELAKNMVNTGTDLEPVMVNQLTQDMFYKGAAGSRVPNTNTIFVIRYDYVLAENITIPDNCVLEFEGGSINVDSYVITGNKMPTTLVYTPEMFGAGKNSDDTKAIQSALNICNFIQMDGNYNVYSSDDSINWYPALWIKSDTHVELNGSIHLKSTQYDDYNVLFLKDVNNITICGNGKIEGDKLIHTGSVSEHGSCIGIVRSNNITIEGLELYNAYGDGIDLNWRDPKPSNINIRNVYIHDVRRHGLSVSADNLYVYNVKIENCFGANASSSAIDVENDDGSAMGNIIIDTVTIKNFNLGISTGSGEQIDNVFLRNISILDGSVYDSSVIIKQPCILENSVLGNVFCPSDATIRNCKLKNLTGLTKNNSTNITYIDDCVINGTFGRTETSDEGTGGVVKITNSVINIPNSGEFKNFDFVSKFKFYNSELNFGSSSNNTASGIELYNCIITSDDTFDFSVDAYNSVFKTGLSGSGEGVFFSRRGGINMFGCLIELGNRNTPLFRLDARADYRVLDSTFIDPLTGRAKTAYTGYTLTEAANIYIENNQVVV